MVSAILLIVFHSASGQANDPELTGINNLLYRYSSFVRPQKVYLHLDKTGYKSGETIWFKAYLFDGTTHFPEADTSNIYIELINSSGDPVELRTLLAEGGYASGDINLDQNLPEGNYVIRAYSDWMRNFSKDYFFTQYLYIKNHGYEDRIPRSDVRRNRRFNRNIERMEESYEVAFFPEGGNLVSGLTNRVAFKVIDLKGRGSEAEGKIVDDQGSEIVRFKTGPSGVGIFEFRPAEDRYYRAQISVNDGRQTNYDLPEIFPEGYVLRVDQADGQINIRVNSSVEQDNPLYSENIIIIGHTRGIPGYSNSHQLIDGSVDISIDEKLFQTGVTHFTIFTETSIPVAERLVFTDNGEELFFSPDISVQRSGGQNYIDMNLLVSDGTGNPVTGSFSVSAVTGTKDPVSHNNDIVSYVLLNSDFKEMIYNPMAYLHGNNDAEISIDNMLLTYGWRRFNWEELLAGELPEIRYESSGGLAFGGRIVDPARGEGVRNHPVNLMVKSGHDTIYTTNSGRGGWFSFGGLVYDGMVEVELSSRRLSSNYPPVFELDILSRGDYEYEPGFYTRKNRITQRGDEWERVRGMSSTNWATLPESQSSPQRFGTPDQTIFIDYSGGIEKNLYEVLLDKARGLSYNNGMFVARGATSSTIETSGVRYMLDGRFVDSRNFLARFPGDIERIEIFTGTSASIFGSRGGTGVVLAYSRRQGYSGLDDAMELVMQGYHVPREYYSDYLQKTGTYSPEEDPEITIHWESEMISGEDGRMNVMIPFYQGIENLRITIEGAGFHGGLGFAEFAVELK